MSDGQAGRIFACIVLLGVIVITVLSLSQPQTPASPQITFDVMIDSGNPGPTAHPCASDPTRSCFGFSLQRMSR